MAMRHYGTTSPQASGRRARAWTFAILLGLLLLAGFVRVGFNYGPATADDTIRFAGNDDYYHLRVVRHVQEEGHHLIEDPLLNYPLPAKNPRPPVYNWHVAIAGQALAAVTPMDPSEAGQYALLWGSAIWGILLVIPVWLLGRTLFNNAAGLWAAFLVAASPANVQRSGFGLGDHDAFILFFLVLGAYFLTRALQHTREEAAVRSWKSLSSVADGFSSYAGAHPTSLAYALLAGVSWGTIALMWEGFPYALAIYAIYYFIQTLSNQMRGRDSTGDLLNMLVLKGTVLLMALPFYWIHGNISSTLTASTYILLGLVIVSLLLVATRDLPWVIVLPGSFAAGLLGLLVMLVLLPDVGRTIFTANGYFVRDKLYTTIAEAQRTDLGIFVFSAGFMTFFLALVGLGFLATRMFKTWQRPLVFLVGWTLVAFFMAFSAARFVFNATPVFAILAGWMVARIVQWIDFHRSKMNFINLKQEGVFRATRSTVTPKAFFGVLFLVLTLLIPNLWFSVDAGLPGEYRAQARENHPGQRDLIDNRTGAFGQGFLGRNWLHVYGEMEQWDQVDVDGRPVPCHERPAHAAWWDYGFWSVALTCKPTVADNFQHGFELTGRMIAAHDEQEGIEWLIIRVLEGDRRHNGGVFTQEIRSYLDTVEPGLADQLEPLTNPRGYDEAQLVLRDAAEDLEHTVEIYEEVQRLTGFRIWYFLVDDRMLPFDDPRTPFIDSGSIFYAPTFLANENPDDYVQTVYTAGGNRYRVVAYERNEQTGEVTQVRPPRIVDDTGRQWFAGGGVLFRATPDGSRIDYGFNQGQGIPIESISLEYHDAFYNSMFYRAFVGGDRPFFGNFPPEFLPGEGLAHWRLVSQAGAPFGVKLLKYFPGAVVTGQVVDDAGQPLADAEVVAVDDFGIGHHRVPTDEEGRYRVLAPFGMPDANGTLQATIIRVLSGGVPVAEAEVFISEAAARRVVDFEFEVDVTVGTGWVDGFVFLDRDRSGQFNETVDSPAEGAFVRLADGGQVLVGPDGRFNLSGIQPGTRQLVFGGVEGYRQMDRTVQVTSGQATDVTLGLTARQILVNGTVFREDEVAEPFYAVRFTAAQPEVDFAANATATANVDGDFSTQLWPGQYTARAELDDAVYTTEFTLSLGQGTLDLGPEAWTRQARE